MNKILILFVLLIIPVISSAVEPPVDLYQKLLKKYVTTAIHHDTSLSWVDYTGMKKDPEFNKLVQQFAEFSPDQLEGKQEQLAFYINTYNILAIKTVIDHWPVKSIKDVGSFLKSVWKKKAGTIGGKEVSLDEIENEILRPLGDPRIHMAIVCASVSCPNLRDEPYTAERIDEQLDDQAKSFLSNPQKGLFIDGNTARTSKIFNWFKKDFKKAYGNVNAFIAKYSDLPDDVKLKANLPYDWSVNGQ
jgi:uncharacterized protein DUF547